jgi:hypothetical protein
MRIRTVKPEFWISEKVGKLSRDARLVFIGLFNMADDEGRFRAATSMVAGALLPYDDDGSRVVRHAMDELERRGLIRTYVVDDCSYGFITGFAEHQAIDRPKASKLPAPPSPDACIDDESTTNRRRVVDASLLEQGTGNREQGREQGSDSTPVASTPRDGPTALQALWNETTTPPLPRCVELNDARRKVAKARLKERPLPDWGPVFERINASPFCRGINDRGWRADFDFALKPGTAAKVMEGKYDPRPGTRDVTRGMAGDKQTYTDTPGVVEAP